MKLSWRTELPQWIVIAAMFALAAWYTQGRKLLLARDPLGMKPLYYTQRGMAGGLAFASELPKKPGSLFDIMSNQWRRSRIAASASGRRTRKPSRA